MTGAGRRCGHAALVFGCAECAEPEASRSAGWTKRERYDRDPVYTRFEGGWYVQVESVVGSWEFVAAHEDGREFASGEDITPYPDGLYESAAEARREADRWLAGQAAPPVAGVSVEDVRRAGSK